MSATFILTTKDPELESEWTRQLPARPLAMSDPDLLSRELQRPGARVWIRDIRDGGVNQVPHADTVVVIVGGETRTIDLGNQRGKLRVGLGFEHRKEAVGIGANVPGFHISI